MVDVRQRQYAIGLRGRSSSKLITENLWPCTAFFGIDERSGVVFLCHLDTFVSVLGIPDLVEDLKKHVSDLSNFRLYTVTGLSMTWRWIISLVAGIVGGGIVGAGWGIGWVLASFIIFLIVLFLYAGTSFLLSLQLRRLNAFSRLPHFLGHSDKRRGSGMCGISIDADNCQFPEPKHYVKEVGGKRFKEPCWWNLKMTKASGSA